MAFHKYLSPSRPGIVLLITALVSATPLVCGAQRRVPRAPSDGCSAAPSSTGSAASIVSRAIDVLGLADVGSRVRVSNVTDVTSMDYQSDRTYPPYLWSSREQKVHVAWQTGRVRLDFSRNNPAMFIVSDSARVAAVSPRGAQLVPQRTPNLIDERAMDVWTVLADWRRSNDLRLDGTCRYRDFVRLVVARGSGAERERLFFDGTTGYPVKLERREPHALRGDALVEYLWQIWTPSRGSRALAPQYTFRVVDGEVHDQRHAAEFVLTPADSAATMQIPESVAPRIDRPSPVPDTIRVGSSTFLLRTPSYTNTVTLQRDTVFVLDAQLDDARARHDSTWIARLFPGRHPVVVLVTDLAWPHVGGVRFWVARGATIASRDIHRPFLETVVARNWQLSPDVLTQTRAQRPVPFRFRSVTAATAFAGGAVRILPIDGAGSEGALMAYLPADQFLWAGDFVQPGGPDSFSRVYAEEVAAAALRAHITPARVAAMHLPLTDWSRLPRLSSTPRSTTGGQP
jgi:hypothetical protein